MPQFVNGVYFTSPGSAVTVNDSQFLGSPNAGGNGIVVIGSTDDGQPNIALSFSSPAQALATLKNGDGLQAVLNVFTGASKMSGAASVWFIRPEIATQATSKVNNISSVEQIALTTTSYGTLGNMAKWMITTGSTSGYKVSQGFDYVGAGGQTYAPFSQDNISLNVFSLYYTGSDTPKVTITDTALTIAGATTTLATIALSASLTVQNLVNQINQVADFNAVALDPNPSDTVASFFDNVTSVAVATSSTSPTIFTANVTAVVNAINQAGMYFTATRQAGATAIATSTMWTYATGGTTPSATNSNWQDAYSTAQSITNVLIVEPASSSYAIWAMNDAHCKYMASLGIGRRGYVGDASGQTMTTEITQAALLNSNTTSIVWPEQYEFDYNGNNVLMAPYLVACLVAGMRIAYTPANALTRQGITSNGMGQTVTPGMVGQGLTGGLCVLAPNQAGTVIVTQDRTTWLQNTAYDKVENSTGMIVDIISADLNAILSSFIGQAASATLATSVQVAVYDRLSYWSSQGYLASAPSLTDVAITVNGDVITGTAKAAIDVPANYIALQLIPTAVTAAA